MWITRHGETKILSRASETKTKDEKQRTTNDATYGATVGATVGTNKAVDTGFVGECAIGFSEETCRRRGQKYNPPQ